MPQQDQLEKEDKRLAGEAKSAQAKLPTYQELLDDALESTFPASDPIAASAATHVHEPHTTLRDTKDWTLKPGACTAVGADSADDGQGSALAEPCEGVVERPLTLQATANGAIQVPTGPCTIEQSEHRAILHWQENGQERTASMPIERYRELLADGGLRRSELC